MVEIGFIQQPDIEFNETFTLVACMDTIKIVINIVTQNTWNVYQMDVKLLFLNAYLEGDVYVEKTQAYEFAGQ